MRGTENRDAFKAYLEGEKLFSVISQSDMAACRQKFQDAIDLDPGFARAWSWLSYVVTRSVLQGWLPSAELDTALEQAKEAVRLDAEDYVTHWDLAFTLLNKCEFDDAIKEYETAHDLYCNFTDLLDRKHGLLAEMAEAYIYIGNTDKAIELLERAKRYPDWYRWILGWAYYNAEKYDLAIAELESMRLKPGDDKYVMDVQLFVAAAYAQMENDTMAKSALSLFQQSFGAKYTIENAKQRGCFKDPAQEERWLAGLRKAGVPEK